jgi:predicted enzyme related to lactoylglutathione lyase
MMEFRLEMVTVPVSDVDRAKSFYVELLGFTVEQDVQVDAGHRFVELMPMGSACTIALTTGYVDTKPGSLKGAQFNVEDADQAREFLASRGVRPSEVQAYPWGRFCFFADPDGNEWSVHEVSTPGHPRD